MTHFLSKFVHAAAWLVRILTILLSLLFGYILYRSQPHPFAISGYAAMGFMFYTVAVGWLALFLLVAAGILYWSGRGERDLRSLRILGFSILILAGEAIIVLASPIYGGGC